MKEPYWIEKFHLFNGFEYVCSCCGAHFDDPSEQCPACGMKIKKTKYDPVYVDEAVLLDLMLGDE